jgi:hypothetical protein
MQERVVIDRIAPRFGPKVIVWFFFEGNDLYDDREFEAVMKLPPEVMAKGTGAERMRAFHGWKVRSFLLKALALFRRWADLVFPNHAPYRARLASPQRPGEVVLFMAMRPVKVSPFGGQPIPGETRGPAQGVLRQVAPDETDGSVSGKDSCR